MSVFLETNHLFGRKPSDVGDPMGMFNAGFKAFFCNIGDYPPEEWEPIRDRALAIGMVCGPWLRTAGADHKFSRDRLRFLIDVADMWDSPLIVNSETELKNSGDALTSLIAFNLGDRDAAISMEIRPFWDVDWTPLAKYPILPQKFPAEQAIKDTDTMIRENWWNHGMKCVVITYGSYHGMQAVDFERLEPFGVYTADDCQNNFMPWQSLGDVAVCKGEDIEPPEEIMAKIGSQHGITAFVDWLQKQPGMPQRGSNYNPNDPATWPWPERLERTLNMMREDHDSRA